MDSYCALLCYDNAGTHKLVIVIACIGKFLVEIPKSINKSSGIVYTKQLVFICSQKPQYLFHFFTNIVELKVVLLFRLLFLQFWIYIDGQSIMD